ncbi:MAG: glutamate synthase subunit beta [Treponema sp.]|nr:glutamate synthase subunit beta [Treponema sp.]
MGKPTGFLEYNRKENASIPPLLRAKDFKEFHALLPAEERKTQAARCMNCGVPMCQSAIKLAGMVTGCPLHNLIPEWNDALYNGQYDMAAWRLLKTSSFPEFTGRVCPALCEKACNCGGASGSSGEQEPTRNAVTIHDNELFIIEKAFETGYMTPRVPKLRSGKKIAVVGSGPAGLACADLLNRRGHSVTVYEREDRVGGLLMYGIPNMKLEKRIIDRRIDLMKAEGVEFVTGADIGKTVNAKELLDSYDAVALCCGAKKARPLAASGTDSEGFMYAVDFLKSVTKSLLNSGLTDGTFFDPKGKNVIVVGGGDTGNDCTGTSIRLGAASVTQIEMMPCAPEKRGKNNPWPQWPKILKTDYGAEESIAFFGKDPRVYETTVKEILSKDGKVCGVKTVEVEFKNVDGKRTLCERPGTEKTLPADLVLVAAGFLGCEDYTPASFGVSLTERNTVASVGSPTPDLASPNGYSTNVEKVFTAGDMHRGQSLVVWAIAEGRECAKEIDRYLMGYTNL